MTDCSHVLCRLRPGEPCAQRVKFSPGLQGKAGPGRPKGTTRRRKSLADAFKAGRAAGPEASGLEVLRLREEIPVFAAPPIPSAPAPERLTKARLAEQLAEVEAAQAKRRSRTSFAEFFRAGWHVLEPDTPLSWNWHTQAICDHVQAVFEGWLRKQVEPDYQQPVRNILFNVPPGTAKSRIVAVFFPAWAWLHCASWKVLCISGTPDVVNRDALLCRQLIESPWYRETFKVEWGLAEDQNAKTNFMTSAGGARIAKGSTAKITGVRADCIVVDDPNDAKEIHSEVHRGSVNRNWFQGIRNRVNQPKASIRIGIMQRLHEDDWSGAMLAKGGVEHVRIPQLFDSRPDCKCPTCKRGVTFVGWRDPRTEEGELLHPERFPLEVVEEEKAQGEYYFAGQHQQRPAPADGGVFKKSWWKWFDMVVPDEGGWDLVMPELRFLTLTVDASFGTLNETSDFNSLLVVGRKGPLRYVLDNITRKMTLDDTIKAIKFLKARWGRRLTTVLVELKANGQSIIDGLKAAGVQGVIGFDPKRDNKVARANAIQPFVQAGDVLLPKNFPWVDAFLHEFSVFPNGSHDDQVDALSQCLIHMHGSGSINDFLAATKNR